jgi:hypothetical protein
MGDTGDDFNALKKIRQEKRASNRDDSAGMLTEAGIKYESKNLGAHLIVEAGGKKVDFWPGTGLWMVRGQPAKRRGVRELMKFVELNGSKA